MLLLFFRMNLFDIRVAVTHLSHGGNSITVVVGLVHPIRNVAIQYIEALQVRVHRALKRAACTFNFFLEKVYACFIQPIHSVRVHPDILQVHYCLLLAVVQLFVDDEMQGGPACLVLIGQIVVCEIGLIWVQLEPVVL